jgi:hypothetical protein
MVKLPSFGIEKPLPISINSTQLGGINTSGEYVSQLKLDEHRAFYFIRNNHLTVLGWRGNILHTEKTGLPDMVLDGGILKTKTFKSRPIFYVFDYLLDGKDQKNGLTYIERYNLLKSVVVDAPHFFIPDNLDIGVIQEFRNLEQKKSKMVERFAEQSCSSLQTIYEITEGFVIKKKDGKLLYRSADKSYGPNQLKLKLLGR